MACSATSGYCSRPVWCLYPDLPGSLGVSGKAGRRYCHNEMRWALPPLCLLVRGSLNSSAQLFLQTQFLFSFSSDI